MGVFISGNHAALLDRFMQTPSDPSFVRRRRASALVVAAFLLLAAIGGTLVVRYNTACPSPCVDLSPLVHFRPEEGSRILDRTGREIATLYRTNRRVVHMDELPTHVGAAFLAIEDQRFYAHRGVDYRRVAGAVIANIRSGGVSEGFSTISMQLARNVFPEKLPPSERTLRRKFAEIRVARDIERRFTKDEILTFYLNTIYLGAGAYGVDAAARTYFGKPARELTLAESALLAGLPKAPSRMNPYRDMDAAKARRDLVLGAMQRSGRANRSEVRRAKETPIVLAHETIEAAQKAATSVAPYFVEEIRRRLESRFGMALYSGGLTIHTTIDTLMQRLAEEELEAQLRRIEAGTYGRYRAPVRDTMNGPEGPRDYLQGAFLAIDPTNGDVLALVGGRSFDDSEFDRAMQSERQVGSLIKPIVYLSALTRGVSPDDSVSDGPVEITLPTGETWRPRNFDEDSAGRRTTLSVTEALQRSRNRATVRIARIAGFDSIAALAGRLGVSREIKPYPSLALGALDLTMSEIALAYVPLARADGHRTELRLVTRVIDREGRTLLENRPRTKSAIDPAASALMREMLMGVVDAGTGSAVRSAGVTRPVAGKTGTTNDATDTWFIGFAPDLVAAVWIGFDQPRKIPGGRLATGGTLAAPVWGRTIAAFDSARAAVSGDTIPFAPTWTLSEEVAARVSGRRLAPCPSSGGVSAAGPDPLESAASTLPPVTEEEAEALTPGDLLRRLAGGPEAPEKRPVRRRGNGGFFCQGPLAPVPAAVDSTPAAPVTAVSPIR